MHYPNFLPHHNKPMLLDEEAYKDPQKAIVDFFDRYHMVEAREDIRQCLKAAFSNRRLRRKALLNFLALQEALMHLLEAATLLKARKKAAIPDDEPTPIDPKWYFNDPHNIYTHWEYLPRHLSEKEYRNPYLVFKKCARRSTLAQWRGVLDGLVIAASYNNMHGEDDGCITYSDKEPTARTQCKRLIELVEAAHLIYVRERLKAQKDEQQE